MTQLPTAKEKVKTLMDLLHQRKEAFKDLLPKYLTPERLFRVAQLTVSKNPLLAGCTPASFVIAMMDCARSGLEPNGKDAAIIPYGTEAQFQPMYQGLVKQAVGAGAAKKIVARLVFTHDRFKLWYDPEPHIEHEPAQEDEGEVVGAYAYAILPDDSLLVEYMNLRQLNHIKAKAKSKSYSPWQTDLEEMYRKTPVKRLFKYLPIPEETEYAIQADNMVESGARRDDIPLLEVVKSDVPPQATKGEELAQKLRRGRKPKETPENAVTPTVPSQNASTGISGLLSADQGRRIEELLKDPAVMDAGFSKETICHEWEISSIEFLNPEQADNMIKRLEEVKAGEE